MTVAVSKALEEGATAAVCASTGNTSASAAAYCGRAGIRLAVVLPEGAIARGKLAQAQICGARVVAVQGDFDDALRLVRELVERRPLALLNSVNPHRLEGQKTAAFEVLEQLGGAPEWVSLPVGNGGNITAYWKGFRESGVAPRMLAGQAEGAAPLVTGRPVASPQTVATAIRIGNPARLEEAHGRGARVRRRRPGDARRPHPERLPPAGPGGGRLLRAGVGDVGRGAHRGASADGLVAPGSTVVCVLTGHGLKDPDIAGPREPRSCAARPTSRASRSWRWARSRSRA